MNGFSLLVIPTSMNKTIFDDIWYFSQSKYRKIVFPIHNFYAPEWNLYTFSAIYDYCRLSRWPFFNKGRAYIEIIVKKFAKKITSNVFSTLRDFFNKDDFKWHDNTSSRLLPFYVVRYQISFWSENNVH